MAHRKMVLTEAGAQFYRTRALQAGDPVTLSGGDARLFAKHGWAEEPKRRAKAAPIIPTVEEVLSAEVVEEPAVAEPIADAAPEAASKATPRKKLTTRRKARK